MHEPRVSGPIRRPPTNQHDYRILAGSTLKGYAALLAANRFPSLKYIVLHLSADGDSDGADGPVRDFDWGALGSILLGLPALDKFLLHLYCSRPLPPTNVRFLDGLAGLQRAGKLLFLCATVRRAFAYVMLVLC